MHTPGPWVASDMNTDSSSPVAVWQHDGRSDFYLRCSQICECFVDDDGGPVHVVQAEANARLIAAAPDMFSILQRVVMDGLPIEPETLKDITRVLAKASTGAA